MTLDIKEDALEVAIGGLPRVVEAILAAPAEARTKALDAAAGSYNNWVTANRKNRNGSTQSCTVCERR